VRCECFELPLELVGEIAFRRAEAYSFRSTLGVVIAVTVVVGCPEMNVVVVVVVVTDNGFVVVVVTEACPPKGKALELRRVGVEEAGA
jgi:hypothetical protein